MDTPTKTPKKRACTMKRINLELAEAKALETTLANAIEEIHNAEDGGGTPGAIMGGILESILAKLQTPAS